MTDLAVPVLVTGATGNVGRHVVSALRGLGVPTLAGGREPARLRRELGGEVEARPLDLTDPATFREAVRGVRGLFLLRPPHVSDVGATLNVLVDAAVAAGVEQVTFLSVDGADRRRWVPHHAVEAHLARCGVPVTILRPGFFAQNLGDAYLADVRDHDELHVPAGEGRVAFVDVRDVAELAARTFTEPALRGRSWTLTGPEPLTFHDVAATLSDVLGRPIRYRPASLAGYALQLRRRRLPWMQVIVQSVLHAGLRLGHAAHVDAALAELLGRPPRTLRRYVEDHRALWARRP